METCKLLTLCLFIVQWMWLTLQCPQVSEDVQTSIKPDTDDRITLNILGLFAMSGEYPAGLAYLPAALLAVEHINQMSDVLPGYKIKINPYNTKCDESQGLEAFYKEVYNPNRTSIMTLGATCSHVTEATAQVSGLWGLIQISYSAISPHLSNRDIFPTFFRVMTPEQNLTVGRIKLFKQFSWKKVHIIYQNLRLFSTLDEYIKHDLEKNDIQVVSNEMFTTLKPRDAVLALKKNDARIIIANMYESKARQVMCAVFNLEASRAWYKKIVWFLPYFYDKNWMYIQEPQDNCTAEQILDVVGNYFSVGSPSYVKEPGYRTLNGLSPSVFYQKYIDKELYSSVSEKIPADFQELYAKSAKSGLFCQQRAPEAYDAVWAIALALNNTLTALKEMNTSRCLEDFRYRDKEFSRLLLQGMMNVSFNAISGPFFFNFNGERTTGIEIWQHSTNVSRGASNNMTVVGTCHFTQSRGWNCEIYEDEVLWNEGQVPVDGVQTQNRTLNIDQRIVCTLCTMASAGIVLSCGLLAFNIRHRDHRVIKMSSPRLNNVILVGCILGYTTILVLDVQGEDTGVVCVLRTFTVVLSFSLTFGALFAKTWRVYEIFTAGAKVLNTRMLRDSSLFLIVSLLILVNCLTLIGWMIASPQKPALVTISVTPASNNNDMNYNNMFQRCDSAYRLHFTWALVAIQGVVILLGTYLAIETRKVTCPELNDSRSIALCIYNVVVLGPVGIIVVMATQDKPEINYALEAGMLILVTTLTQCLIFIPKIIAYRKHNSIKKPNVNITFKFRNLNEIRGIFTLDPVNLNRDVNSGLRQEESSESCQATQKTDICEVTCPSRCQCVLRQTSASIDELTSQKTNYEGNNTGREQTIHSVLLNSTNNTHARNRKIDLFSVTKLEKCGESTNRVGSKKHLLRSKSQSNLKDGSNSESLEQWTDRMPQDITEIQSQTSMKGNRDKTALEYSHSFASKQDESSQLVLDAITVKADLQLSSRIGLKASWRDDGSYLNNAQQICQLLSRLKKAVEAEDNGGKS